MNCDEVDALFEAQERLIETLTAALEKLTAHADAMEAREADYHNLSEQGVPCRSDALTGAIAALGFYADGKHHHGDVIVDRGELARTALAQARKE